MIYGDRNQGNVEDLSVEQFQIGTINSSGAGGNWVFGNNNGNKNAEEDLSVQQFDIKTINSSGAGGVFTFGNNNKVEDDLSVQ
jgi:protein subunit release factor B